MGMASARLDSFILKQSWTTLLSTEKRSNGQGQDIFAKLLMPSLLRRIEPKQKRLKTYSHS